MRFQVPQFVDIEDRIIGPFTLKQFLIYVAAVLFCVPLYIFSDLSLFLTIAIPVMGIAALFAHFRINGKSLFSVIANAMQFFFRGQVFVWQRSTTVKPLRISGEEYGKFSPDGVAKMAQENVSSLAARARSLETEGKLVKEDEADPLTGESNE